MRVHRVWVICLAKVVVKNDGERKVMCSFNIEVLVFELITEMASIAFALVKFLLASAREIAVSLIDDPARVSGLIKLFDGITQVIASRRFDELGRIVAASLGVDSEAEARRIFSAAFGLQIDDIREEECG